MKNKLQIGFLIANIVLLGIGSIPVLGLIYTTWLLFIPVIGFSIYNFITSKKNGLKNKTDNLVIMVLSAVGIIPIVGWFCKAVALAFTIKSLVGVNK